MRSVMLRNLVCFKPFYFAPVCLIRFALTAFHGKVFLALLLVDILKGFISGSFPRFRATRVNCRKQHREENRFKQIYD